MRARRNNLVSVTSWVGQRLVVASMILLILPPTAIATQVDPSYVSDISPILAENCVGCHSIKNKMGGLRLDTYEGLIEAGKTGPSLIPCLIYTSQSQRDISKSRMPSSA